MAVTVAPTGRTLVAFVFALLATACVCAALVPSVPWYSFKILSLNATAETRRDVEANYPPDSPYRVFWAVVLLLGAGSAAGLGLALAVLFFVLVFGRYGFQSACSNAAFVLGLVFALLGLFAAGATTVFYALRHARAVPACREPTTAGLPFCHGFWAHDDLGNEGAPSVGWYLTAAAAVCAFVALANAIRARPVRPFYSRIN